MLNETKRKTTIKNNGVLPRWSSSACWITWTSWTRKYNWKTHKSNEFCSVLRKLSKNRSLSSPMTVSEMQMQVLYIHATTVMTLCTAPFRAIQRNRINSPVVALYAAASLGWILEIIQRFPLFSVYLWKGLNNIAKCHSHCHATASEMFGSRWKHERLILLHFLMRAFLFKNNIKLWGCSVLL